MWTKNNYRRIFLDMHIDDWDEKFLSLVDPESLVNLLADAGTQQIVVKCRSHTGLSYYPTKIGRLHRGLKGRNYVKEMTDLCHSKNIAAMAYFSQIFDNSAYDLHPDWRSVNGEGKTSREYEQYDSPSMFRNGRYGIVCPNNEDYRLYVKDCLTEILSNYKFESIFLDMPFWPEVCYCQSCRNKYFEATGKDFPRTINWYDPDFREWQHLREEWMGEFAAFSSACAKKADPDITVEHNASNVSASWRTGTTDLVSDASDYTGGDLFGGYLEQSFICKYYHNLSKSLPFVYITSRCDPNLTYHTTTKSKEELLLHAMTALVHDGAFSICDGANPDGTLSKRVYTETIGPVFSESSAYEKYVGGKLYSDAAIWFSSRSKYNISETGKDICPSPYNVENQHEFIKNLLGTAQILRMKNIPYTVLPDKSLNQIDSKLLIISNMSQIQNQEMQEIENHVQSGGNLYISGHIAHSRLFELLEASFTGITEHSITYINPTPEGKRFFSDFDSQSPMAVQEPAQLLKIDGEYELLGTVTLPYTMTGTQKFSSIHSNPPGVHTDFPAAILKKVGKGKIFWVAAPIESSRPYMSRKAAGKIFQELCGEPSFQSNAPDFVEIVGWEKDDRIFLDAINQQETAPITQISDIEISVPYKIKRAWLPETNENLRVDSNDNSSTIHLPKLHIVCLLEIERIS